MVTNVTPHVWPFHFSTLHQTLVDQALMLWVGHDTKPHALSPKVKQFNQAQHWFQDLSTTGMCGLGRLRLARGGTVGPSSRLKQAHFVIF